MLKQSGKTFLGCIQFSKATVANGGGGIDLSLILKSKIITKFYLLYV